MKRCKKPFLPLRTSRVLLTVIAIVLVLGYYGRVRAQSGATDPSDVSGSQGVAQSQFVSVIVPSAPAPPNPITGGETGDIIGEGNQGGAGDDAGPIRGTGADIDRSGGNSAGNPMGHPGPPLP